MIHTLKVTIIFFCFISLPSFAKILINSDQITITGVIEQNEFEIFKKKFESILIRDDFGLNELDTVILEDVKGGSVTESIKIADFIRNMRLKVHLRGDCYSACVMLYFASVQRSYDAKANLGVHRIRFDKKALRNLSLDEATNQYQAAEQLMLDKLTEYGASGPMIELLRNTSSRDITLLPLSKVTAFPIVVNEWLQDSCDTYAINHLEVGYKVFRDLEEAISLGAISREEDPMKMAAIVEKFGKTLDPSFTFFGFGLANSCVTKKLRDEYWAKKAAYCKEQGLTCGSLFNTK